MNSIFIWIPKNAGSTVQKTFNIQKRKSLSSVKRAIAKGCLTNIVTFGHLDFTQISIIPQEFVNSAFKFCFCRNPYDRMVSLYAYITRTSKIIYSSESFLTFCLRLDSIPKIGLYNRSGLNICNPQVRWVENVKIDYTGRIETFDMDMKKISTILGIPCYIQPFHLNKSKRAIDYKSYYCAETKQIVEYFYAEDFKTFGYKPNLDLVF